MEKKMNGTQIWKKEKKTLWDLALVMGTQMRIHILTQGRAHARTPRTVVKRN